MPESPGHARKGDTMMRVHRETVLVWNRARGAHDRVTVEIEIDSHEMALHMAPRAARNKTQRSKMHNFLRCKVVASEPVKEPA
jgi:hypothetical protein